MAKVSSATIRLVQKLNRKNKNGEYPLYIVVCYGGRIEKATKISCLPKFWDGKHRDDWIHNKNNNAFHQTN